MTAHLRRLASLFRYAWLFSLFINLSMLALPLYMLQVYDRVLPARSLSTLVMLTIGAAFVYAVYALLEGLRSRLLVQAGVALDDLLTGEALSRTLAQAGQPGGARHAGAVRDVATLRQYLGGTGLFAFFDAPWTLVFLAAIFLVHGWLGATALAGMLVLVGLTALDEWRTRPLLMRAQAAARQAGQAADAALRQAEVIEALGLRAPVTRRWLQGHGQTIELQALASERAATVVAAAKGTRQLLQVLMLGVGAYLVLQDRLSPGAMIAATILLGRATAPLELATAGWKGFVDARGAHARLRALFGDEAPAALPLQLPPPRGALSLERVVFGVEAGQPPIIKGISLDIAAGQCVAVIGPSASGKSTLLRLLLGLWRPQSGSVRLDGADVADWPREALGPHLGYLPQEVELLPGSVADNIGRLQPLPQASDGVVAAARLAGAHDMILRLASGYETVLGEGPGRLSGGQRQRIGLARAVYGAPRLVVLDEPNAHLDSDGEQALMQALAALRAGGSTVVFSTHKPSLLAAADRVLVLAGGSVLAWGSRDEVLARMRAPGAEALPAAAATTGAA
jgi:PrtD family type I secretion system ABC transporter